MLTECKHNQDFSYQIFRINASEYSEATTRRKGTISPIITASKGIKHHCYFLGFTLIEMMVVIGIIAIITLWAVPGIKKAYEDFKIKETLSHVDTFVSSFRSFYLIKNEFPEDSGNNYVKTKYAWCLPNSYYTRTLRNSEYQLNIKPYQATAYDIDNWLFSDRHKQFYITIYRQGGAQEWYARLLEKYPMCKIHLDDGHAACLSFMPNLEQYVTEDTSFRNRYY